MDKTCKTCRWWGDQKAEASGDSDYANVRVCLCPKIIFGIGSSDETYRSVIVAKEDEHHVLTGDEAAVQDGSGYSAAFLPGPDFGCVHHEAQCHHKWVNTGVVIDTLPEGICQRCSLCGESRSVEVA